MGTKNIMLFLRGGYESQLDTGCDLTPKVLQDFV